MSRVIVLSSPRLAQAFVDYMRIRNIDLEMRIQGEEAELWLADDSRQQEVREALDDFLRDPLHPRYQAASWQTGSTSPAIRYPRVDVMQNLRRQAGTLTWLVTGLALLVYVLMLLPGDDRLMRWLSWPANGAQYFQVWRWFSHALLHFSLLHILFNLMWWWYLGGQMEKALGSARLLTLTLLSALLSGMVQSWFSGIYFGGLSGVVYALMGYVWLRGERQPGGPLFLPRGMMIFALLWLIVGYFDILGLSIANAAHVMGLVVGLAMAFWDTRTRK
ncbi:rhomboid family intramembrane serine protease GlpG [Affinibrenneria salicis]|uniref:Rhomboid protease GlpG n=1 Tax=Affinibrenneria salicis TaxID=2590031 RepID=A0A5J5FSX8_9GAMM|nr:rhomboid family intramembrane serine protease GlpG [Affinibrenneria salicis]KAA8996492.1 rhomboid family intramembrane serine protease GlpG [Affinibrenneria salicis]